MQETTSYSVILSPRTATVLFCIVAALNTPHLPPCGPRQLSAFEFRHYRTGLEQSQQKLVERVVNQWVAMLVKARVVMDFVS